MQRYLTLEVSASIMIPYNEDGAIQLQKDGREQAERNFEAAIIEQLERDSLGVSVTTCACSIVHPENLFTGYAMCSRCQYKDKAYPYCEYNGEWLGENAPAGCDFFTPAEEATT